MLMANGRQLTAPIWCILSPAAMTLITLKSGKCVLSFRG
jgi:hypothetical protein